MKQKINLACPYCHTYSNPDMMLEVAFDNFTISFKCKSCHKDVRIYLKMISYGELG